MSKLTVLVLADVECAWCKKLIGRKFINSDNTICQAQIKDDGRLVSHGICNTCQDDLLNDENKTEETARELKPVMEMIEAAACKKKVGCETRPHERRFQEVYI